MMTQEERNQYCENQILDLNMYLNLMEKAKKEWHKSEDYERLGFFKRRSEQIKRDIKRYKSEIK